MNNAKKVLTAISIGMSISTLLFLLKEYVYQEAMKEQDIFKIMILIFAPLFVIGLLFSCIKTKSKCGNDLICVGLLFTGVLTVLLAYLDVYHLQMLLPLVKTNSVSLVVMWIARVMGGITGLFCGLSVGATIKNGWLHYLCLIASAVALGISANFLCSVFPYQAIIYIVGGLSICASMLNSKKKSD